MSEPPKIGVWLVGDSTMANKPKPEVNPERGWGQSLQPYFDDRVVVHNHAVNGRSTKSFIDQRRWQAVVDSLQRGDYVFIEFGHNDEKVEDTTRYAAPRGAYRRNLERFVAETRARGAIPVLFTPIVRRKWSAAGALEDTHGEYPAVVAEVARATATAFVDLESLTRDLVRAAGPEGSKRLYVYVEANQIPEFPQARDDDTHLSPAGAAEVARLAAGAIRTAGLSLSPRVVGIDRMPSGVPPSIPLWDGAAPGAVGATGDDRPSITPFLPGDTAAPRSGVLIFPGGGYEHLALDKEGVAVARWLNARGIAAFVVRYRVGPRYSRDAILADAEQAMRLVRRQSARWRLDPARIGVAGFSAGGHLAAMLATGVDPETRPAFMVLAYPVVTLIGPGAHAGSRRYFLGERPDDALARSMSVETRVTSGTPSAFIVATSDDASVPVANAERLYAALHAAGVPAELHLFAHGHHGFGLAAANPALSPWTLLCDRWLTANGWAAPRDSLLTKRD